MSFPYAARRLNDRPPAGGRAFVLLWMQQAPRARCNPALEFAVERANGLGLPLAAVYGLDPAGGRLAHERHAAFLLEGLFELREALADRGVPLLLRRGDPAGAAAGLARKAALVVCDRGYLREAVAARARMAREADCEVWEVEGEVCVPVELASDHEEVGARTLRPKLLRFLRPPPPEPGPVRLARRGLRPDGPDGWGPSPDAMLARWRVRRAVGRSPLFRGGETAAQDRLRRFLETGLAGYLENRADPARNGSSGLSPYLAAGQLSALEAARRTEAADAPREAKDAFLEQLIVRRELSVNFVRFQPDYDRWEGLPAWARRALSDRAGDPRDAAYGEAALEAAKTHDPCWNAAQLEMVRTGFMHNTMRMYWGKKILEWSPSPQEAFRIALRMNSLYELDGSDPNGFAGVAWCFGKHDRPWARRPVFGTVRYMNERGLRRKYDIGRYIERVRGLDPGGRAPV